MAYRIEASAPAELADLWPLVLGALEGDDLATTLAAEALHRLGAGVDASEAIEALKRHAARLERRAWSALYVFDGSGGDDDGNAA